MVISPLEHFELQLLSHNLWGGHFIFIDFSLTTISLGLLFTFFFLIFVYIYLNSNMRVISQLSQSTFETYYSLVFRFVSGYFINIRIARFFPLFFCIFTLILLMNVLSLVVVNPSLTGHLVVTFFFGLSLFIGFTIIGFLNFGATFVQYFIPRGLPIYMIVFLTAIEVFSFLIRPVSLSVRLFANMLAGHTLLGIFAKFYAFVVVNAILIIFVPIVLLILIFFLEIAVSVIQAYIFLNLALIYFNDVLSISH